MTTKDDGGPAYPGPYQGDCLQIGPAGMTLRDHFAATADIPWNVVFDIVAGEPWSAMNAHMTRPVEDVLRKRAQLKYMEADAMLAERKK